MLHAYVFDMYFFGAFRSDPFSRLIRVVMCFLIEHFFHFVPYFYHRWRRIYVARVQGEGEVRESVVTSYGDKAWDSRFLYPVTDGVVPDKVPGQKGFAGAVSKVSVYDLQLALIADQVAV